MRPCLSCFSLFLHRTIIWSIESTFLLHTFQYISSTLVMLIYMRAHSRLSKTPTKLIPAVFHTFFQPLAVPTSLLFTFHLTGDTGAVLIGKQRRPIYLVLISGRGIPQVATAQTSSSSSSLHTQKHTHAA